MSLSEQFGKMTVGPRLGCTTAPYSGAVPRILAGLVIAALLVSCGTGSPPPSAERPARSAPATETPATASPAPATTPEESSPTSSPGQGRVQPASDPADLAR